MREIILLSLLLVTYLFFSKFESIIKETFSAESDEFSSIRNSQAWFEGLGKSSGNEEFNHLLKTMPADLAMLTYISQKPDLQKEIEREVFPEDSITRSSFLEPAQLKMNYDDRLHALYNAKFSFLNSNTGHEQDIYQALKSDPICRGIFAKVLMTDDLFGCLLNNLGIGGDLDYCFFDYFAKNPSDFKALTDAFRRLKSGTPCSPPPKSPNGTTQKPQISSPKAQGPSAIHNPTESDGNDIRFAPSLVLSSGISIQSNTNVFDIVRSVASDEGNERNRG